MILFNKIKEIDIGPAEKFRPNINQTLEKFTKGFEELIEKYSLNQESDNIELQKFFDFCRNCDRPLKFHGYCVKFDTQDSKNFFGRSTSIVPDTKQPYQFGLKHCNEHPFYIERLATKSQHWYKFGQFHNETGPAFIGIKNDTLTKIQFCKFNMFHNEDGPAKKSFTYKDVRFFSEEYFQFGAKHREDGPEYINIYPEPGGIKKVYVWYRFGFRHNENGPAIVEKKGPNINLMHFYQFGYKHREDGPAECVLNSAGQVAFKYYLFGFKYTEDAFNSHISNMSELDVSAKRDYIYEKFGVLHGVFIYETDEIYIEEHYQFGKLHREDGPAHVKIVKNNNGSIISVSKTWYMFGLRHRINGPAVLKFDFNTNAKIKRVEKIWYKFGYGHREDGPAYEKRLYKKDVNIYTYDFMKFNKKHRDEGPAEIEIHKIKTTGRIKNMYLYYYQFGQFHNENGPAQILFDSFTRQLVFKWYLFGFLHKENGPARMTFKRVSQRIMNITSKFYILGNIINLIGPVQIRHTLCPIDNSIKLIDQQYSRININLQEKELSEISDSYFSLYKAGVDIFDAPNIHRLEVLKDLTRKDINSLEEIL